MKVLAIGLLVLLTGCAEWSALKTSIATYGAQGADEALTVAQWEICEAATVGAIKREYQTAEGFKLWWAFCGTDSIADEAIRGIE